MVDVDSDGWCRKLIKVQVSLSQVAQTQYIVCAILKNLVLILLEPNHQRKPVSIYWFFIQELQFVKLTRSPGFNKLIVRFRSGVPALPAGINAVASHPFWIQLHNHAPGWAVAAANGVDRFSTPTGEQIVGTHSGDLSNVTKGCIPNRSPLPVCRQQAVITFEIIDGG